MRCGVVRSGGDGNFILSTSFLGFLPATGLVPAMCDNGYGFFYSIIDSQSVALYIVVMNYVYTTLYISVL